MITSPLYLILLRLPSIVPVFKPEAALVLSPSLAGVVSASAGPNTTATGSFFNAATSKRWVSVAAVCQSTPTRLSRYEIVPIVAALNFVVLRNARVVTLVMGLGQIMLGNRCSLGQITTVALPLIHGI
jgi:hypothetical protein